MQHKTWDKVMYNMTIFGKNKILSCLGLAGKKRFPIENGLATYQVII